MPAGVTLDQREADQRVVDGSTAGPGAGQTPARAFGFDPQPVLGVQARKMGSIHGEDSVGLTFPV
jgi:hypothetical protein